MFIQKIYEEYSMKNSSIINPLLGIIFCISLYGSDEITYTHQLIAENPDFMSAEGWGSELLLQALDIPIEIFPADLFLPPVKELSIVACRNGIHIGFRHCNWMKDHLVKTPKNLIAALEKIEHENTKKYLNALLIAARAETELIRFLETEHILLHEIVHNCGLLVLKPYQNKGVGVTLQKESINMLKAQGIKAIVSETTHYKSAHVMKKCGFIKYAEFSYKDFDISGFDDSLTVWYLVIN
jgi:GNAT superfamily N-acetyltransferase